MFACKKKHDDAQPSNQVPDFQSVKLDTAFYDDFLDNHNDWYIRNNDTVVTSIENGEYFLRNGAIYSGYYFEKPIAFDKTKDFSIITSISRTVGNDNAGYGLIWGAYAGQYFEFFITQTGYFKIQKWDGSAVSILIDWTQFSVNGSSTTLQVSKQGSYYYFFLNKKNVFTTPFQSLYGTGIGFIVSGQGGTLEADYLTVLQ